MTAIATIASTRRDFTRANAAGELDGMFEYPDPDYIDVASTAKCPSCGLTGLVYHGFRGHHPTRIRAFFVCTVCGDEREV